MDLFIRQLVAILSFIGEFIRALFILPVALVLTLWCGLVHGYWGKDKWIETGRVWKEAWNNLIDFLSM